MRHHRALFRLPATALALLATAAQAAPTPACINPAEMRGLIGYFLPEVIDEVTNNCAAHLSPDNYLRAGLPRLGTQLAEAKTHNWPVAKAAFLKMSRGTSDEKRFVNLSDKALRPIVDAAMSEKLKIPINPSACADVNDITEALAPLDANQTVNLLATIFTTVARKDSKMRSCPRETQP